MSTSARLCVGITTETKGSPFIDSLSRLDLAASFSERGYAGPVPVFSVRECRKILALLRQEPRPPLDWDKGWAATSLDHYALATNDRILDLVTTLIGEDVLLWGASLIVQRPGGAHPWHTDIETASPNAETISVWIGLTNTSAQSSLKVVPFSHRFGETLQQARLERDVDREDASDADVETWARERDSRAGVVAMDTANGEALLFDGRLWHGSHNPSRRGRRCAVLLQYATPRTPINIPNLARLEWPFDSYRVPRPACIVVSGRDTHSVNRLVAAPTAAESRASPALTCRVHSLRLPLDQDPMVGWKPHSLFRGATPAIRAMQCHASVLDPGRQPHPLHQHAEEELLVVLDGEAALVLDGGLDGNTVRRDAKRGSFAYYPAGFAHTISNASDAPVTYLMFKWTSDRRDQGDFVDHHLIRADSYPELRHGDAPDFSTTRMLEGQTRYLRKLHAHITVLQPGAGYAPHVDAYDVGIVVLEGTVETLGEQVGRNGVIFYAAGESHGMRNVGDTPARYLVFEFHGGQSQGHAAQGGRLSRALRRLGRDPQQFKRAATHAARSVLRRLPTR